VDSSCPCANTIYAVFPYSENWAGSAGPRLVSIRHYTSDHSMFIDSDYLIKGVASAILWKLLTVYAQESRTRFTNRELRLDPHLGLPEVADNLEARLALLKRRLEDRSAVLRIEKEGRGRFRLAISCRFELQNIGR
jgi:adenylate cyclase